MNNFPFRDHDFLLPALKAAMVYQTPHHLWITEIGGEIIRDSPGVPLAAPTFLPYRRNGEIDLFSLQPFPALSSFLLAGRCNHTSGP